MKKMRKKKRSQANSQDEWILTYSDIVTLLLAFFVLLFSFSTIDAKKWREIVKEFTGRDLIAIEDGSGENIIADPNSNVIDNGNNPNPNKDDGDNQTENNTEETTKKKSSEDDKKKNGQNNDNAAGKDKETTKPKTSDDEGDKSDDENRQDDKNQSDLDVINKAISNVFSELYNSLNEYSQKNENVNFDLMSTDYQIRIRLYNNLLFDSGKAEITKKNKRILHDIGDIIFKYKRVVNKVVIEGNTDNIPIRNTQYRDNFELSFHRSMSVLYYLRDTLKFEPEKLIPMGYGEYNPIADNKTAKGRAKNRRTDIVIVKEIINQDNKSMDYYFLDKKPDDKNTGGSN